MGQTSNGLRWPYGPVALITPFNFPLEIPVLQLMGALYMGNKPLLHVDHRVSIVAEQFVRLLHECGMPRTDVDMLHGPGGTMGHIMSQAQPRSTLFTGKLLYLPLSSRHPYLAVDEYNISDSVDSAVAGPEK
jgi:1-pyrroline-5-carboxylate dehydrogenase